MDKFKAFLYRFINKIYIPKDVMERDENIVLHISDTPDTLYYPLKNLIKKLKPEYIIHTGDLVDNIKLQFSTNLICSYEKKIKILLKILEESEVKKVYLCMGNHDSYKLVNGVANRSTVVKKNDKIKIEGVNFNISHYSEDVEISPEEFNLFGHNLNIKSKFHNGKAYLNGIESINIINLKTKKIYKLHYPYGTDEERLGKGKMGF